MEVKRNVGQLLLTSRTNVCSVFMSLPALKSFIIFNASLVSFRLQKICGEKTSFSIVFTILDHLDLTHSSWDAIYTRAELKNEWDRLVVGRTW